MSKILQIFYISVVAFLCTESFSNTDTNNNYDPSQTPSKHSNGPSQTPDGRSFSVSTNGEPYSVTTNAQSFSILANAQSFSVSTNGEYFSVTTNAPSFSILANGEYFSVSKNGKSLSACISNPSNSPAFPFSPSNSPGFTCSDSNSPALRNSDSPGFPLSPSHSFSLSATETPENRTPQLVAQNGRTLFSSSNSNHTTETNELPFFSLDKSNHTSDQNESSNSNHTKDLLKQTLPQSDDNDNDNNQNIHLMGAEPTSQEKENSFSSSNSFGHKKNQPENTQEYLSSSRQDYHPSSETAALFSLGNSDSQNSEGTQNSESVGYSRSTNNQGSTSTIEKTSDFQQKAKAEYLSTSRQDYHPSSETAALVSLGNSDSQNSEGTQNSDSVGYSRSTNNQGSTSTIQETSDFQQKAKAEPTSTSRQDCHPSSETAVLFSSQNSDSLGYSDSQRSEDTQNSESVGYSRSTNNQGSISTIQETSDFQQKAKAEPTSISIQDCDPSKSTKAKYEEWLLFSAASYMAYPSYKEDFREPEIHPATRLKEFGYKAERITEYVILCKNEEQKKAIFAISGTCDLDTLGTTIASFNYWNKTEYDNALKFFFPRFLSKPYSAIVQSTAILAMSSLLYMTYNCYMQTPNTFINSSLCLGSSAISIVLYFNLLPRILENSIYVSHISTVLKTIEEEKKALIDAGFEITITGHSLGGHAAQVVAAFHKDVNVFSISAIGGAYLNACRILPILLLKENNRSLQMPKDFQERIQGIVGENDPVGELSFSGDIKHIVIQGDEPPLKAHSIVNIHRTISNAYTDACINKNKHIPLWNSKTTNNSQSAQAPSNNVPPQKSWWKIWDWWKDSKTTVDANTPSKKNLWNLYGLLRTRILDMQKIITAN